MHPILISISPKKKEKKVVRKIELAIFVSLEKVRPVAV